MSLKIPAELLAPKVFKVITRSFATDRPYSTALGLMPEVYDDRIQQENFDPMIDAVAPKAYNEIPGPKQLPVVGNSWRFAPFVGHYKINELDKVMWSLYKEYGKIVKVGGLIGHPDLLFVFDGDDIQKVFRREEEMPHRPSMPSLHYYKQHLQKDFFTGNEGVIGVHGPKWDVFRKQVQQVLLPPATAKKYISPLNVIATDFLTRCLDFTKQTTLDLLTLIEGEIEHPTDFMENMLDEKQELPANFLFEIYKWALESVARVALDTRLGCLEPNLPRDSESQRIIDSINTFFWNVAEVELKMPIWRVYKNKAFRKYIGALEDFRTLCLKYIYQAMDKNPKQIFTTTDKNQSIVEIILEKTGNPKLAAVLALDLLLVGVDTTSVAAASTIYQLSQNPDKQQKLFEELQKIMPHANSEVDSTAQENMPFLKACIKETLRMYPVIIGNGRNLQSDTILAGYKVPKGTHVIFPHLVVSNSTEYFTEPEKFIPERWIKTKRDNSCPVKHEKKIHPFVSLPFGYGRRSCLGRRFAETELNILIAKIFRKYQVEYNYRPLNYKITPTYVPEEPLKFKLTKRC